MQITCPEHGQVDVTGISPAGDSAGFLLRLSCSCPSSASPVSAGDVTECPEHGTVSVTAELSCRCPGKHGIVLLTCGHVAFTERVSGSELLASQN